MSKKCSKCGLVKPYSEYYRHSKMADGYLNKCKECHKTDVKINRNGNLERYRAYDRDRGNRQSMEYVQRYREENPKKYKAHNAVNNAIRDGKLLPLPCEECGDPNSHGHHDDYDNPLSVRWLCAAHHKVWHTVHGEGLNAH